MASDVSFNSVLEGQARTQQASTKLAEDFSSFLNLLTLQLQNQDPLDPMDSQEFTNQLVAFTGVEQQINTNQKLDTLLATSLSDNFSTALNYVGLEANYIGSEMNFDGERPVDIKYSAPGAITTTIQILDENGDLVYSEKLDQEDAIGAYTWDGSHKGGGLAEPGTYSIRVDALDADGEAIETTTVVNGIVTGLETQNGQLFLLVGERAVALSQMINVKQPSAIEHTGNTGGSTDNTDNTDGADSADETGTDNADNSSDNDNDDNDSEETA